MKYYAVVTKGNEPMVSPMEALQDIEEFNSIFTILYPDQNSLKKLEELIAMYKPKGVLIHDFEIASIALVHNITQIASFNKSDFQEISEIQLIEM